MKSLKVLSTVLISLVLIAESVYANVFASNIRITNPNNTPFDGRFDDGTGARIQFVLNDTASVVTVKIANAVTSDEVSTINAGAMGKGEHAVNWSGGGTTADQRYLIKITALQSTRSGTSYSIFTFIITGGSPQTINTRGVDIVQNQHLRNFGYMYAGNREGTPMPQSILKYRADGIGAGDSAGYPVLARTRSPGLWGNNSQTSPLHVAVSQDGRIYASAFEAGLVARVSSDTSSPRVIFRVTEPKGLAAVGTGTSLKIYVAAGTYVLRANMGTSDTLTTKLDTVASLGVNVRDVIFDDRGFMYVNLRMGAGLDADSGLATERYDISGQLPVTRPNALWSLAWRSRPVGLAHWSGANTNDDADDIVYVSMNRAGKTDDPGIWEITDVTSQFPVRKNIFKPDDASPLGGAGGDASRYADLAVDPAGNVVYFENGNEEIIMLAPPSQSPTNSFTTSGPDSFLVQSVTSVEDAGSVPINYSLSQNYPNPFNPSTTIEFSLPRSGYTTLRIYDLLGRESQVLVNGFLESGNHKVRVDGSKLSSGIYFYSMRSGDFIETKKMSLVK